MPRALPRFVAAPLCLALTFGTPPARCPAQSAPSTTDLERRVEQLEEALRQLKEELRAARSAQQGQPEAPAPGPLGSSPSPPDAGGERGGPAANVTPGGSPTGESARDGAPGGARGGGRSDYFTLRPRGDDSLVLRLTGQIQADYRPYLLPGDQTDIDTFFLRRARFGLEADLLKQYEFRFLPDYGQGKTAIQDSYLNLHYWDGLQFEVGKFKQPVSYEQLIQDRFVPTVERSMIDQLVPSRDVGVMAHGQKLFGDRLEYAMSISNGEINGDFDVNDPKDFDARVAVRPFNDEGLPPWLRRLQLGVSGGYGTQQEPINPSTLRTPLQVLWFQFNPSVRADGARTRLTPELSYFWGGLGLAAQYYHEDQQMRPAATGPSYRFRTDVGFEGFYVLATYLLTGEERTTYSEAIAPLRPFDPLHLIACPGGWELVGRVSQLELNDDVFAPGLARLADPTRFSRGAAEATLGFNWYLNRFVRMQFNYEHSWFDQPVQLGVFPVKFFTHMDALDARFQIIF
jgi:phosphate-selective porin OprO/OprP